jgi:hypothetical protein
MNAVAFEEAKAKALYPLPTVFMGPGLRRGDSSGAIPRAQP